MKRIVLTNLMLLLALFAFGQEEDKTQYITNPSFENGTNGWSVDGLARQDNNSFALKAGTYYMEKWTSSGNSVGNGSVKQVIQNLPRGQYKLTVSAQNLSQNNTSKKNTGAYIFAGDDKETVYTPDEYSVTFTNIIGEVEIGFEAKNATGNWIAVDNFRLYQIGEVDAAAVVAVISDLIAEAEALQSSMMSGTAASDLQAAITAAKAVTVDTPDADMQKAYKDLKQAIAQAQTSIAEYQALATKIADVEAQYDETLQGAADLKAVIDAAKVLVANPDATSEQLADQIAALDKALLAFKLANATPGTGTAPQVTETNHYVATGATQALMRAKMVGSNILERGVCWSTEHNPTVLDNRTTKNFSLKGLMFHIKGLEPATVYYLRPYVMNRTYTVAYGDEVKIVTHPKGTCNGTWDEGAPDEAANTRCRNAIKETIEYFNEWTGIKGFTLSGHYGSGTPTADCSYGGWMRIGPNASYQAIGTVLHETGHGVGVGTHWRWYDCKDTRENTSSGKWLGREANDVLHFLENYYGNEVYFTGDKTHGWGTSSNTSLPNATISYDWLVNGADKDKHTELQYIGGMCILHGLFIDGLCPTSADANGISGYTYNFDDGKKYYLMCKDKDRGLGTGLLYQRSLTGVSWKHNLADENLNDSAAWYMEFNAKTGYYMFKNAATGKYLSHASAISVKDVQAPSATELFQLMPDRTDVTIGTGSNKIKTHGFWFTWSSSELKAMGANKLSANTGIGTVTQATFNYANTATAQQWIIISEDELEAYRAIAIATSIDAAEVDTWTPEEGKTVNGFFSTGGVRHQQMQKGFNIIRYSDGTSKKVVVK